MKNLIQAAVVTLFAASAAQAQQAVQWKMSDGGNGHWYATDSTPSLPWATASDIAASRGGHLAAIGSAEEWNFVLQRHDAMGEEVHRWLGGYRFDDQEPWTWETGEPWVFSAWGGPSCPSGPYPNNGLPQNIGCAISSICDGVWDDFSADAGTIEVANVGGFVIEWSADCNNDGIVDYGQILRGQLADTNTDGVPDICQCATNPSLPVCCPGDLDHDAMVGGADIGLLLSNWGPCGSACLYDLNNDDKVNGGDLGLLLAGWGPCSD